jgi:hypothetical protein
MVQRLREPDAHGGVGLGSVVAVPHGDDVRVEVLFQEPRPGRAVALHRRPKLREIHPVLIDEGGASTGRGEQVRGVGPDEVARRLEDRAVGPRDGDPQLIGSERETRIDHPQRRPHMVPERVLQHGPAHVATVTDPHETSALVTGPQSDVALRCEHTFVSNEETILHADVDSFYASVEQRDDPLLRGRPVIVGAGVVLAASYEAKAYGIRTPMGGAQARRLCPQAVVVRPRMEAYSQASKTLFEVFNDTTPFVEGLSIDEAFLDVGGLRLISGTPTEIAVRLRRDVLEKVGLPVTVGVARTKFLAKVASGVAKPDGLLVVPTDAELEFLHPLPVERLWGPSPQPSSATGSSRAWGR